MGYPDLKSDESIVLTAQHVKVKSVPFELVLTNRRLIIIDSEKNVVPTQQIQLYTIRNVMASENAIRDPVITLTILTDTADTREMALTFVRQTAGERRREADEWVKALRKNISEAAAYSAEAPDTPAAASPPEHAALGGTKKKIEVAGPIKKIMVDTSHMPPKPVETTSLPEGSFCGRCGNRIPPGSTFCNRCGTKVAGPAEEAPAATAPQIATAPAAAPPLPGERRTQSRPIEQIIHSIEPLIADSVPRAEPAPAVPSPVAAPPAESAPAVSPAAETPAPADASAPAAAPVPDTFAATLPPMPPIPPIPPVPEAPKKKSRGILVVAVVIVIILAVVAGGFVLMNMNKTPVVQPVTTPVPTTAIPTHTPTPTSTPTAVPTVAVTTTPPSLIPQTGVWAEINYDKTYSGLVGIPGSQTSVSDTGDHFYRIPTVDGSVAISVQKTDGSGDTLTVTVYKDGSVVKTSTTTTPYGSLDVQLTLATPTATPTPVLTPTPTLPLTNTTVSLNKTGNTT